MQVAACLNGVVKTSAIDRLTFPALCPIDGWQGWPLYGWNIRYWSANYTNLAMHSSRIGKLVINGLRRCRRPLDGRSGLRMAVWLHIKVRERRFKLQPRLYAGSVCVKTSNINWKLLFQRPSYSMMSLCALLWQRFYDSYAFKIVYYYY